MRWFKRHVLELILLVILAAMVIGQYLFYFDIRNNRRVSVKTTVSDVDSLKLQNAWLVYNDSLMRVERKVTAPRSLKILAKEKGFQKKSNEEIKRSPLGSVR